MVTKTITDSSVVFRADSLVGRVTTITGTLPQVMFTLKLWNLRPENIGSMGYDTTTSKYYAVCLRP